MNAGKQNMTATPDESGPTAQDGNQTAVQAAFLRVRRQTGPFALDSRHDLFENHPQAGERRLSTHDPKRQALKAGLAAYAMRSSDSRGRAYPGAEHPDRTIYQRDRDHCPAKRQRAPARQRQDHLRRSRGP